jgi:cysteine-rich repeat protein
MRSIGFWVLMTVLAALVMGCGGGGGSQDFATCGNGRIDTGERCDDGNTSDADACTTACQPARCGDGVIEIGVEDCDGRGLNGNTCALVGKTGFLSCTAGCTYDFSACGAEFTPTGTATDTPTVTPSAPPTPTVTPTAGAVCGDHLLSDSETCEGCPDDCMPPTCSVASQTAPATVAIDLPAGAQVTQLQYELRYRTSVLGLPATGFRGRFAALSGYRVNVQANLGYAATGIVIPSGSPILASGQAFTVAFDRCAGSAPPSAGDFVCLVTVCRGAEPIAGCTCSASPGEPTL